jgi:plastocyanin domain-containing protein
VGANQGADVKIAILTLLATAILVGATLSESQGAQTAKPATAQKVEIAVTSAGFVPALTKVKVGQVVTMVVTRKVEKTCATDIVIKDFGINKPLPLNEAVEITLTPSKPGKIRFACSMDMVAGELQAE